MALQTALRRAAPSNAKETTAFWPEPSLPELPPAAAAVGTSRVLNEAEWIGGPANVVPMPMPTRSPVLSPGLARLINAAAIDSTFAALFLKAPMEAARQATNPAGDMFGAGLPDATLRLTLPALTGAEWALLRHLPPTESLAAAARELRSFPQGITIFAVQAVPPDQPLAPPADRPLQPMPVGGAPTSQERALAGAA